MKHASHNHNAEWKKRWSVFERGDTAVDFLYAVKTTGIYCRIGCASRRPLPENVIFFRDAAGAEQRGFRPCKRCRPNKPAQHPHLEKMKKACHQIEQSLEELSLMQLADAAAMSAFHFQRTFRALIGITPKQYAKAHRMNKLRDTLIASPSVTEAMMNAGWNTLSRGYEDTTKRLGMQPRSFHKGGQGEQVRFGTVKTTLGWMLVAATGRGICMIALDDDKKLLIRQLQERFPNAELSKADAEFTHWMKQASQMAEQPATATTLPLDMRGTVFQELVWQALKKIPAGSMISYAQLAEKIGKPKAVRAVATACANNPVAIIVPCHRVVGGDGKLRGYRWGLKRKQALLKKERGE